MFECIVPYLPNKVNLFLLSEFSTPGYFYSNKGFKDNSSENDFEKLPTLKLYVGFVFKITFSGTWRLQLPKNKNIDISKMTESQFNSEMEKAYQEMQDKKGISVTSAFSSIKRAE